MTPAQSELLPASAITTAPCACCGKVTKRTYYWCDTTLCAECGKAWETSADSGQRNPAATLGECEQIFNKWLATARQRIST